MRRLWLVLRKIVFLSVSLPVLLQCLKNIFRNGNELLVVATPMLRVFLSPLGHFGGVQIAKNAYRLKAR